MVALAVGIALVALLGVLNGVWAGHQRFRVLEEYQAAQRKRADEWLDIAAEVPSQREKIDAIRKDLERWHVELITAVAEGIDRVDRAESRVQATLSSAEKKFKKAGFEAPGVEAEIEGLRLLDGAGSGEGGMLPVQEGVESDGGRPSPVPGLTLGELKQVRGF